MNLIYIIFFLILIIIILVHIKNQYLIEHYEIENTPDDTEIENTPDDTEIENTPDGTEIENTPVDTVIENPPVDTKIENKTTKPIDFIPKDNITKPVELTKLQINLSPKNNIIRTCNRADKMCYYELDKIIKANKMLDLSNSFKVENNKGHSFILSSSEDPILIQKGIQVDVKVVNDRVEYQFSLLK